MFLATGGDVPVISHPRSLIVIGPDSQATVVESYLGHGANYFTNAVTEIVAGDHSVVDHYKLQEEDERSFHVATLQVQIGRDANFSTHSISLGGGLVRNDINSVLAEGTEATVNGLYLASGSQHVDNHTTIDHAKPHGTSHELYKGILGGTSAAVFNGKIIVRPDAQKTDAKQTNKNLRAVRRRHHQHQTGAADPRRRCSLHARGDHRPTRSGGDLLPAVARHRRRNRRAIC